MILFSDLPDTKNVIISAHGMLPILEILETCRRRDVISNLLKIVNAVSMTGYFHYLGITDTNLPDYFQ